ncbi:MAG: nitrous oxide reductase accessory protein NosL [Acidobacteriota bacterium]|nr:nitrous oxide reductase accessory protein NosL [Acidobacteriota bacterium]
MNSRRIVLTVTLLILVGAGVFGWYRIVAHPKPVVCGYCLRPLHANVKVTAEIDGKRVEVCCPRCAITEANQERKHMRLITVHDYSTGKAMSPEGAWYVEGSRVLACDHVGMHMDDMKDAEPMTYDRCSPGTLTFATRQQAEDFTAANGGTAISFSKLMSEARFQ